MKKIIAIMLAALMLLSLAACGKTTSQNQDTSADTVSGDQTASTADNEAAASAAGKLAAVFATGGLGDKTYTASLYAGVKNVCDTMGLQFDYSEPMDAAEYEPLLRGYAETGEYALIISLGYSQGSSVEAVAPNYPDQNFMLIDAEVDCAHSLSIRMFRFLLTTWVPGTTLQPARKWPLRCMTRAQISSIMRPARLDLAFWKRVRKTASIPLVLTATSMRMLLTQTWPVLSGCSPLQRMTPFMRRWTAQSRAAAFLSAVQRMPA